MKPIRSLAEVSSFRPRGLDLLSWDDRRRLLRELGRPATILKLIELMGPLHALHPAFRQRERTLLPLPNLAGRQPCFEAFTGGPWQQIKMFLAWAAR